MVCTPDTKGLGPSSSPSGRYRGACAACKRGRMVDYRCRCVDLRRLCGLNRYSGCVRGLNESAVWQNQVELGGSTHPLPTRVTPITLRSLIPLPYSIPTNQSRPPILHPHHRQQSMRPNSKACIHQPCHTVYLANLSRTDLDTLRNAQIRESDVDDLKRFGHLDIRSSRPVRAPQSAFLTCYF